MKALTIRQPWASLIALGVKRIETRSWSTRYRGPLAIHAGMHRPVEGEDVGDWWWADDVGDHIIVHQPGAPWRQHPAPLGAIVATCTLADVLTMVDLFTGEPKAADHFLWVDGADQRIEMRDGTDLSDQSEYGDFTPGRYAWLLTDISPCDPIPAKGRQGLWELAA